MESGKNENYKRWAQNYQNELDQIKRSGDYTSQWLTSPWQTMRNAVSSERADWKPTKNESNWFKDDQRDLMLEQMREIERQKYQGQQLNPSQKKVQNAWELMRNTGMVTELPKPK